LSTSDFFVFLRVLQDADPKDILRLDLHSVPAQGNEMDGQSQEL
jgi:hypothetical protein